MRLPSKVLALAVATQLTGCQPKGGKSDSSGADAPPGPAPAEGPQCNAQAGEVVVGGECKKDETEIGDKKQDPNLQLTGGTLDVAVVQTGALALDTGANLLSMVGQANATQLKSMKYWITSIQICKDMEVNGSGFNNPVDCLEIYKGAPVSQEVYGEIDFKQYVASGEKYDVAKHGPKQDIDHMTGWDWPKNVEFADQVWQKQLEYAQDNDDKYIDLMNPESLKKLSAQLKLTEKDAHEYKFGLVNWNRPIKVKAEVPLFDGNDPSQNVLFTKASTFKAQDTGGDHFIKVTSVAAAMNVGPAEEAIVAHNNGGAWFKFAKPFVITKEDIEKKRNFKLDLTFNPDGIAKGYNNKYSGQLIDETNDVSIAIPMLQLTPVAHAADQKVVKESYLLKRDAVGTEPFDLRVELYGLKGDSSKTVLGVDTRVLFTEDSVNGLSDFPQAFFVEQTDSALELQDYQGATFLTLTRQNAGDAATTAKVVSSCFLNEEDNQGHPGFLLPEYQSTDCAATPTWSAEDDVSSTLVDVIELP